MIRTDTPSPIVRLLTDDDRLIIVRKREGSVFLHIEDLFDESHEIQARLRPDQVASLVNALTKPEKKKRGK